MVEEKCTNCIKGNVEVGGTNRGGLAPVSGTGIEP